MKFIKQTNNKTKNARSKMADDSRTWFSNYWFAFKSKSYSDSRFRSKAWVRSGTKVESK